MGTRLLFKDQGVGSMAAIKEITVHYEEKRSANFQSITYGLGATVTLVEGELPGDVIKKTTEFIERRVATIIDEMIEKYQTPTQGGR